MPVSGREHARAGLQEAAAVCVVKQEANLAINARSPTSLEGSMASHARRQGTRIRWRWLSCSLRGSTMAFNFLRPAVERAKNLNY